jgi:exonuclease SbcC
MIIKSIQLNKIRSYNNSTIEFEDGINFLSGDIGCGKSSILLAIEFALFGFKKGDVDGFQLLRKGEIEGFVKLILINPKNDDELEIYRKIKMSKTGTISQDSGYIKTNSDLQELSPQELNAYIFEKLNFPKEFLTKDKNLVYRFTNYTPQEQLKEVLFASEEKRLEIIRKIFRIDKYKQLVAASNFYISDLKVDKKIIEAKRSGFENIKKDLEQINNSIISYKEKSESIKLKEKSVLEIKEKVKSALIKLETSTESLNEKKIKTEKNLSLIEEFKNTIKDLNNQNETIKLKQKEFNLESIENKKKIYSEDKLKLNNKIKLIQTKKLEENKLTHQLEILSKQKEQIQTASSEQTSNQKLLESLNQQFDLILTKCNIKDNEVLLNKSAQKLRKAEKLQKKYDELNEKLITSKTNSQSLQIQIQDKQNFMKKFESIDDCPTCMQKVDTVHSHTISKTQTEEIEKLIETKTNLRIDIKKFTIDLEELKFVLDELKDDENTFAKLEQIQNTLKEKYTKEEILEKQKTNLKQKLETTKEVDYQKNIQTTNQKIDELKLKQNKIIQLNKEELEHTNEISKINQNQNQLELEIKDLETEENKLKENNLKLKKLTDKLQIEPKLKDNQKLINSRFKELKEKKILYNSKLDTVLDNEKKISNILTTISTQLEFKTKELELKESQKLEFETLNKQFKSLIKKENFISQKMTPIAQNIEKAVFTKYYVEFNEIFSKLFKDLIEDNEIEVRLNELFSIIVEQNGFDIDIKNLSGGEKSSLAIAYRLGLKQIIENNLHGETKLDILILDEPTDGFSNEQVDRLGNILKNSDLKQTILVSHDEKIESISDRTIKIEKINHVSKVL